MKKSLIALAVLAASGAAMAQSSVTLFGVIDTNISVIDNIGAGKDDKYGLGTSGLQTSRIGFRGVEDLGGGLKAGFHLEGEIFGDDGNSSGLDFKRRSTLSLMGGFGEVRLGRDQTVGYVKTSSYDVFGQAGYGQFLGWSSWSAVGPDTNGIRKSNMISYFTPKFSGFSGAIGYGFDEQTTGSLGEYIGGYVAYDNGPLSVALSYDQSKLGAAAAGTTAARKIDRDTIALGASYDFGVAKVSGIYQQVKHDEAGRNDVKVNSYALGVSAPVGSSGIVKAQYAMYDQKNVVQGRDAEANHFSLGYQHNLSKRTALYGTVSYMDNDNGSTVGLSGKGMGTTTPVSGESQTGFQVGIRHAF
ncbi:porin [Diaphorobacter sp.]|uniref:porin n=1 Tax=Diaphorobacter sp. TaxID=1934310 RepID=UPI003D0B7E8E